MKTGLLMSVVMVGGMVGAVPNVRAACTTTPNCESLGYQYCASECPNGSVACPFDSNKHFCFSPNPYTVTAETCAAECKNVGSQSCTRGGVTYYESCGSSKCSSGQICSSGTCKTVPKEGECCGYNRCRYSGTSHTDDDRCQDYYGESCYNYCMRSYPTCNDMWASCRAQGGTPVFQNCDGSGSYGAYLYYYASFVCL